MGSFAIVTDKAAPENLYPLPYYQIAEAALNMMTLKYAEASQRAQNASGWPDGYVRQQVWERAVVT